MKFSDTNHRSQSNNIDSHATTYSNILLYGINGHQFYVGVVLAILSSIFIGASFILKKKSLIKLSNSHSSMRAASGGFGYLCEVQWWIGFLTMGFGEAFNFIAYGFAPASVVTPLGALSVLVSTILAVRFLNERLNAFGKIGCILTTCGSIVIIIHAPKEAHINSLIEFSKQLRTPDFILFSSIILTIILFLIFYYAPRKGSKYVHVYLLICSFCGAFTVTACKGFAIGLKEILNGHHTYSRWLTSACLLTLVMCIVIQMIYLNRSLDLFPTPVVTTVYYVLFTACVLITSGIFFREWGLLSIADITASCVGFLVSTCGIVLINCLTTTDTLNTSIHMTDDVSLTDLDSSLCLSLNSNTTVSYKKQSNPTKLYSDRIFDDSVSLLSLNSINE